MIENFELLSKKCEKCSRLCSFLETNRKNFPDYFNNPVPSFGEIDSEFLIVGLAPGLNGANKTGRPFTGDYAGDILYNVLTKQGFTKGTYLAKKDDNFSLINTRITNAVRCVPPENKPTGEEIKNCNNYLKKEIENMCNLKVILVLGRIAHEAVLRALEQSTSKFKFEHGNIHLININSKKTILLVDSYHTSRYNINTKRLTLDMFEQIVLQIKEKLK
ncbi:MAG: uracil-DNA glycosylase [Alphaproteobacteria bacterium]|nr:uracil-DNA glycosylase [Alphaproteobacteria bacterium]